MGDRSAGTGILHPAQQAGQNITRGVCNFKTNFPWPRARSGARAKYEQKRQTRTAAGRANKNCPPATARTRRGKRGSCGGKSRKRLLRFGANRGRATCGPNAAGEKSTRRADVSSILIRQLHRDTKQTPHAPAGKFPPSERASLIAIPARSGLARQKRDAHGSQADRPGLLWRVAEHIFAAFDGEVAKTGFTHDCFQFCFQQSAGNSAGPRIPAAFRALAFADSGAFGYASCSVAFFLPTGRSMGTSSR